MTGAPRWRRTAAGYASAVAGRIRTDPQASMDLGPTIPGALLHLLLAVCAVGAFVTAAGTQLAPGVTVTVSLVIAATVVAAVRRPGYLPLGVALVPTAVVFVALAPVGYSWRVPVLMVAIHATLRLCWYTTQITPTTRVELAVLGAECRRFVLINLVGQAVALLAGVLTAVSQGDDTPGPSMTWLAIIAAVLLALLAAALRTGARAWPREDGPPPR